ncbi:hypothetical protein HXX76_006207 [Chlamydomonas incerta]|uniref:Glycosyl transferase CAP10 domain-containing protein n=1 Tax=Chlamydomonas incerta TaxID=51695 RepID=A0A835W4E2_CHLIN|nr:hypothetical protein HXX76_006207 [Chlamydomonas incerta]|eukprot:KAG2436679.1 hypothetical protein HXX76_006207 [Chlamydomonas incerta]
MIASIPNELDTSGSLAGASLPNTRQRNQAGAPRGRGGGGPSCAGSVSTAAVTGSGGCGSTGTRQRGPPPLQLRLLRAAARLLLLPLALVLLPLLRQPLHTRAGCGGPSRRTRTWPAAGLALALAGLLAAAARPAAAARARSAAPPPPPLSFGMATLQARYPNHSWSTPVVMSDTPRGPTRVSRPPIPFIQVRNHSDQAPLYDENLELDLAPWRRRAAAAAAAGGPAAAAAAGGGAGGGLSLAVLVEWALTRLPFRASQRLVVIRGGRVGLIDHPGRLGGQAAAAAAAAAAGPGGGGGGGSLKGLRVDVGDCAKPCDPILEDLLEDLRAWASQAPGDWPDAVFLLNTADTSLCAQHPHPQELEQQQQEGGGEEGGGGAARGGGRGKGKGKAKHGPCPAPVLSSIKEWGKYKDEDVLVPITVGMHRWRPLAYFPWRAKADVAAWRGREYCHTRPTGYSGDTCSRTYLAGLSAFSEEWSRLVDVGFVDNYTARGADGEAVTIPARGFVPTQELARFRYVLALDGITASSRLARLLSLNSVVVKQTSPWIEWYYRSLVAGTHYVAFWNHHRTDLLNTLRYIRHKSRYLMDVSVHGQAFAYRYLTPAARRLYWQRALEGYVALLGDTAAFMDGLVFPPS